MEPMKEQKAQAPIQEPDWKEIEQLAKIIEKVPPDETQRMINTIIEKSSNLRKQWLKK